jgi:hypothetical protein
VQRVHRPDQRDRKRQRCGGCGKPIAHAWRLQRSPDDPEQRQRGQNVDGEIEGVITPQVSQERRLRSRR